MKKIYCVHTKKYECYWDEYDAMIVIAESKEEALQLVTTDNDSLSGDPFSFNEYQIRDGLVVDEIQLDKSIVLLKSYHAG